MVSMNNTPNKYWFNILLTVLFLMIGIPTAFAQAGTQSVLFQSFRDGNSELYKMAPDGSNVVRLTNNSVYDAIASWSPDGSKIVFHRTGQQASIYSIWIMNADGSGEVQLTPDSTAESNQNPAWSPDGSKILFSKCETVNFVCDLYTMDPDGANEQVFPLSDPVNDDDQARYSYDGTKIIYVAYIIATNATKLMVANADGTGTPAAISQFVYPEIDFSPRFSPDGTKVAFLHSTNYGAPVNNEVWTMNADGSNRVRITTNSVAEQAPMWSPDGTELIYSSMIDGDYEIYRANADGSGAVQLTANALTDIASDWYRPQPVVAESAPKFDFDGDGRSDRSVFRGTNGTWYLDRSTAGFGGSVFGAGTDAIAPADYDGDGKTDIAVWRASEGNFYIFNNSDNSVRVEAFGISGDIAASGDWDGDGKADVAVYRGSAGTFYYRGTLNNPGGGVTFRPWGMAGDIPVDGDFDGDSIKDAAVFRPSNGVWYIWRSTDGIASYVPFGLSGDKLIPADYDGDGKTDVAVFRNGVWYIMQSSNGGIRYAVFGLNSDVPVPADYDGDAKADVAIFRNGLWYIDQSTAGLVVSSFGMTGDKAVPAAYVSQ